MKCIIDYVGNINEHFFLNKHKKMTSSDVKNFMDNYMFDGKKGGDVLIIPGNISEYNERFIDFLKHMQDIYKYEKILFTLGNHEFYLRNVGHALNYYYSSEKKITELINMLVSLEKSGIHMLDGNIIKYKGISFGGAMGWYDGSYGKKMSNLDDPALQVMWEETQLDYKYILNMKNYKKFFMQELYKFNRIVDKVDVVISNVAPLSEPIVFDNKEDVLNSFSSFNGERFLKTGKFKYWIYNSNHIHNFIIKDKTFLSNPLSVNKELLVDGHVRNFFL